MKPTPSVSEALQSRLAANERALAARDRDYTRREQLLANLERVQAAHAVAIAAIVAEADTLSAIATTEREAELDRVFGVCN